MKYNLWKVPLDKPVSLSTISVMEITPEEEKEIVHQPYGEKGECWGEFSPVGIYEGFNYLVSRLPS